MKQTDYSLCFCPCINHAAMRIDFNYKEWCCIYLFDSRIKRMLIKTYTMFVFMCVCDFTFRAASTPLHHHCGYKVGWLHAAVVYTKFWRYHPTNSSDQATIIIFAKQQTTGALVWSSHLTEVAPSIVLCCCSASASRFNTLCIQRCSLTDLACNDMSYWCIFSQRTAAD